MKNCLQIWVLVCLMMAQTVFAQNIELTFTGADAAGKYVQLDSVRVENISRSWTETLVYPDTVLTLTDETGVSEAEGNTSSCISYPNPFNGTSRIVLTLPQDEQLSLRVYNLAGQLIMEKHLQAEAGENHFEVSLHHPQVYFLVAQTARGRLVQKLINTGHSGDNSIAYIGNQGTILTKTQKLLSSKPFQAGDVLRITGYTTHYGQVASGNEILQPQRESEHFNLVFSLQYLPTLTTASVSHVTGSSALCGGTVTDDGGAAVVTCGVCWSESHNPTINDNHTLDDNSTDNFTSIITGLKPNTTYYVRAYATNAAGTAYGNELTFTTPALPTLSTSSVSHVTDSSAVCGGTITNDGGAAVITRGVVWSESHNPTIDGNNTADSSGIGSFTSNISGLKQNTTYYVRAYATNAAGTAYGNEVSFTTKRIAVFSVSATDSVRFSPGNLQWSATNGGNTATTHTVAGNGTAAGTWRFAPNQWDTIGAGNINISSTYTGWIDLFGWGTSGYYSKYPYMTSTNSSDYGNGNSDISGTYYDWGVYNAIYNPQTNLTDAPGTWRTLTKDEWVYMMNTRVTTSGIRYAKGTVMGRAGLIIVPDNWNTAIYTLDSVNTANATFNSNIISAANWTNMEDAGCVFLPATGGRYGTGVNLVGTYGGYWSASYYPSTGAYYLVFHLNNVNPSYNDGRFYGFSVRLVRSLGTQGPEQPTLSTSSVSSITDSSAVCGGNVFNGGGVSVTARGICWDTLPHPVISGRHTVNGSGLGSFTSNITGLKPNTTYYVRAYATNAAGTAYGNELTFTTRSALPRLSTYSVSNITDSSAVCGGNVTNGGGAYISVRGVCWDTLPYPTISKSYTVNGSGTGSFTSNITGLKPGTKYYVRAYAVNSAGTAYGNQITFTTLAPDKSFSVAAGKFVRFSPGNLQWSATGGGNTIIYHIVAGNGTATGEWRFAPNQWDTIGASNSNIDSSYTGWIDLFGWGTSGYNNKQPYMTSTTSTDYGNGNRDIAGTYYDWGVYNAIYNPKTNTTDAPGTWRTLTKDEWYYLMRSRTTPSGIRCAKAKVNGVNGLVVVPDNWSNSIYTLDSANYPQATYESNLINATHWANMEAAGCVFLPAAGYAIAQFAIYSVDWAGEYWSATSYDDRNAYNMNNYSVVFNSRNTRFSVRLVRDVQ